MEKLNELKIKVLEKLDWFLMRYDIRLKGNGGRIASIIFVIYFGFSMISDLSSINYGNKLAESIEKQIDNGSSNIVNEIIQKHCQGIDLSIQSNVDECIAFGKEKMLESPKNRVSEAKFDLVFLILSSLALIGGYFWLAFRQKRLRAEAQEQNQNNESGSGE